MSIVEVNAETRKLFQGESSSAAAADLNSESLLNKANRLINELKSDPLARVERHTRKLKLTTPRGLSRQFQKNIVVIDYQGSSPQPFHVLHDYDKVYERVITLKNSMTEEEVRSEVVSLVL